MKLIFKGDRHVLNSGSRSPGPAVDIVVQGRTLVAMSAVTYQVPAGDYDAELVPCPLGHNCQWVVLAGTLIGASLGSLTQWTGEAWFEYEVVVLDDDGTKLLHPAEGEFTLEEQARRIAAGIITDRRVIDQHHQLVAAKGRTNHTPA